MREQPQIHLLRGHGGCTLAVRERAVSVTVDALRASVTIALLLQHGCTRVLVVADVEDTRALAAQMPECLLVGERGGERLPGFDLGNSPLEVMASPRMDGRTAIFTSSNGAQRLRACGGADRVLVGSTANAGALAAWVRPYALAHGRDVVLIAAGRHPDEAFLSPEDLATCAYLATRLGLPIAEDSRDIFTEWEHQLILHGLEGIFRESPHARRLMEIGYSDDVLFCARVDTVPILPVATGPVHFNDRQIGVEVVAMSRG